MGIAMKKVFIVTAIGSFLGLSGCASLTGLDADSNFSCAAPEGVSCDSMGGVYANMGKHGGVSAKDKKKSDYSYLGGVNYAERNKAGTDSYGRRPMTYGVNSGIPIRTEPKIMKIWVAPWQSEDRTLYDQSYAYIVVDYGDWVLAHNKNNIIDEYAPVSSSVVRNSASEDRVINIPKVNNIGITADEDAFTKESNETGLDDDSFKDAQDKALTSGYSAARKASDIAKAIQENPEAYSKEISGSIDENLLEQYSINANGK